MSPVLRNLSPEYEERRLLVKCDRRNCRSSAPMQFEMGDTDGKANTT